MQKTETSSVSVNILFIFITSKKERGQSLTFDRFDWNSTLLLAMFVVFS